MTGLRYNERAWAIDVITEINRLTSGNRYIIRRAGGEAGVVGTETTLFPDVLLFADAAGQAVLQGWELKFPDTPITDAELLERAGTKARILGLSTFLVWNVTQAVIYSQDPASDIYLPVASWNDLTNVRQRADVQANETRWKALIPSLLRGVSDLIDEGLVRSRPVVEAFRADGVVRVILQNVPRMAASLRDRANADGIFDAWVTMWWASSRAEYRSDPSPWSPLARLIITTWVTRLVFAHVLRNYDRAARRVTELTVGSSQDDARAVLEAISRESDFLTILRVPADEPATDDTTWQQLVELTVFLAGLDFEEVGQAALHRLLEDLVEASRRKSAGQYTTPAGLAQLLVELSMVNRRGHFADPFCGTGTIARAAVTAKHAADIPWSEALATTWASDKFRFPVHLASLALAVPEAMGEPLRVFAKDATHLRIGEPIALADPHTGDRFDEPYPSPASIASNLPFVQFEHVDDANPGLREEFEQGVGARLGVALPRKSDLYAYLPFYLWELLAADGRIGLIMSNAWLGTDVGDSLREHLERLFRIRLVIVSGEGRWFANSSVVTSIAVMDRRGHAQLPDDDEEVRFATIDDRLDDLDEAGIRAISAGLLLGQAETAGTTQRRYRQSDLTRWRELGLRWSAMFTDTGWIDEVSPAIVRASDLLHIARGKRRGWDPMFYPPEGHGVEADYLRPVLLTARSVTGLVAEPDGEAFCCTVSEDTLVARGHHGALTWIERFRHAANGVGRPLPDVLAAGHQYWYGMDDSAVADLVVTLNPGSRLFVARLRQRSFVNQRLTRFTARDGTDIDLLHALLNTSVSLFWLEALGFGRGLGALDLSSTRLRDGLHVINPDLIEANDRARILEQLGLLLERDVLPIHEELDMADRREFDMAVMSAVGLERLLPRIRGALRQLVRIRSAVDR